MINKRHTYASDRSRDFPHKNLVIPRQGNDVTTSGGAVRGRGDPEISTNDHVLMSCKDMSRSRELRSLPNLQDMFFWTARQDTISERLNEIVRHTESSIEFVIRTINRASLIAEELRSVACVVLGIVMVQNLIFLS